MEPLKPSRKREILQSSPTATAAEVAEYEKLLAERFTVDPDLPRDPVNLSLRQDKSYRLRQLRQKLFPDAEAETTGEKNSITR
jgi:hypothetical protein